MAARKQLPYELRTPRGVPGLLYEPRAFWSVGTIDTTAAHAGTQQLVLPRNDFLNGEKYPITLTKLTFLPVNYFFQRLQAAIGPGGYHLVADASFNEAQILISAPQRQQTSREPIRIMGHTAKPTWEPEITTSLGGAAGVTPLAYASSLWNVCRWDFDFPMLIPPRGGLELGFSGITIPSVWLGDQPDMPLTVAVYEGPQPKTTQGGELLFPGNLREARRVPVWAVPSQVAPFIQPEAAVLPAKAAGFTASIIQTWQPETMLTGGAFKRQNANAASAVANPVTGFAVHIEQIDYDDEYEALAPGVVVQNSILTRIAARARMTDGGTKAWWWRPGAPLALVCPTITPALVYELPEPITLGPGDDLEIEINTPGPVTVDGNPETPVYQVGVGLCGYAAIEG